VTVLCVFSCFYLSLLLESFKFTGCLFAAFLMLYALNRKVVLQRQSFICK